MSELLELRPAKQRGTAGSTEDKPILDPSNPMQSARKLVERHFLAGGLRTLHRHRGAFYRYTGTHYAQVDEEDIKSEIWLFLENARQSRTERFRPSKTRVAEIEAALSAVCALDSAISSPAWLSGGREPPYEFMAVANGLLHLTTRALFEPSPDFFGLNASEAIFARSAPAPSQWFAFLDEIFPDDNQAKDTLQECFGYCLSTDTRQHKIFMMVGPKRSGKGTTARILKRLIGSTSMVAPTLSSLSSNFGLEPLIGKPVAVISDARLSNRSDQAAISERLLSISGEDAITIDRKFRSAWTGRLPTRFILLTNELPQISDAAGALASRFIVLVLKRSFYGQEDPHLESRLASEMSGILNWALTGYHRLMRRGHFIQPASAIASLEQLETLAAPVTAFVREKCQLGSGFNVVVHHLYFAWRQWCEANGRKPSIKAVFGRDLIAAFPGIQKARPRDGDDRFHVYEGIKLL
jgi:putative DNA primase/helicase